MNKNKKYLILLLVLPHSFFDASFASDDSGMSFITPEYLNKKMNFLEEQPSFLDCMQEVCPDFCYEPILSDNGRPEDSDKAINRAILGAQNNFPQNVFSYGETIAILEHSKKLPFCFEPIKNSLPVMSVPNIENAEIFYVSDLHGNKSVVPLLRLINKKENRIAIFGGDFFDRGLGIEEFILIMAYACCYKNKVFVLSGDHEARKFHEQKGTKEEIERRFPNLEQRDTFNEKFYELLRRFPVAGFINGIFFSHALVYSDEKEGQFESVEIDGDIVKISLQDNGATQRRNEHNRAVISSLFSINNNILVKNDSGVFSGYIQLNPNESKDQDKDEVLINTPLYVSSFSNKRWRSDNDFNNIVKPFFKKNDPDGSKIKIYFNGHDQPQDPQDQKFKDIEKYGFYVRSLVSGNFLDPKNEISELFNGTCGVGGSNFYNVSKFYFPFNNICPGLSRYYAICYQNKKIYPVLLEEDKDSYYFAIKKFWEIFKDLDWKDKRNFPTMEHWVASYLNIEENRNALLKILDNPFTTNVWLDFLKENENFFDQEEFEKIFSDVKEYLKDQKYSKKDTDLAVNTGFFVTNASRIVFLIEQINNRGKAETILNRLLKLKNEFGSERDTWLEKSKYRGSLNLDFAKNFESFLCQYFYDKIDEKIIVPLKDKFNLKKHFEHYKDKWSDFCKNTFYVKKEIPVSLSFTDGFATYSTKEKKVLSDLLCNDKFRELVNKEVDINNLTEKLFINSLIVNAFASSDLTNKDFEWINENAKEDVILKLVDFLNNNDYLSTNSKCVVLSNIALFLKNDQQFPFDFDFVTNILKEQLIQLCDVGFAIEKPIDNFGQIFSRLNMVQSTALLNDLLHVSVNNYGEQLRILMSSVIRATSSCVNISQILPMLLEYKEIDLNIFEKFCINGFRDNPQEFLNFFDKFICNQKLHIIFQSLLQQPFIFKLFEDDSNNEKIKICLKKIKQNKNDVILELLSLLPKNNKVILDFFYKNKEFDEKHFNDIGNYIHEINNNYSLNITYKKNFYYDYFFDFKIVVDIVHQTEKIILNGTLKNLINFKNDLGKNFIKKFGKKHIKRYVADILGFCLAYHFHHDKCDNILQDVIVAAIKEKENDLIINSFSRAIGLIKKDRYAVASTESSTTYWDNKINHLVRFASDHNIKIVDNEGIINHLIDGCNDMKIYSKSLNQIDSENHDSDNNYNENNNDEEIVNPSDNKGNDKLGFFAWFRDKPKVSFGLSVILFASVATGFLVLKQYKGQSFFEHAKNYFLWKFGISYAK